MRIYGRWSGRPQGAKENIANCAARCYCGQSRVFYQCNRKRGHGKYDLLCKQHAGIQSRGGYVDIPEDEKTIPTKEER